MTKLSSISVIILGAGAATRMGSPKQLLNIQNKSMVEHAIETAVRSNAYQVILVLGAHAEAIAPVIKHRQEVNIIYNEHWARGMGTSIRAGIEAIIHDTSVRAVVIMLCDQPLVTPGLLQKLTDTYLTTGKPVVACRYGTTLGVPALFDRIYFDQLLALKEDEGARKIIRQHVNDVMYVPFEQAKIDLDTPGDYADFLRKLASESRADP